MNWPNLVPVPELYRWLRDDVPGGHFVAPLLAYAGIGTLLLIAARYWWVALLRPLLDLVGGQPISTPSVAQAIVAAAIALVALAVIGLLQIQIRKIRRDLHSALVVQTAIIEGLPKDLETLKKRILDLESHTDIHGLQALLIQRFLAGREGAAKASLEGLRRAANLRSEGEDP